MCSCDDCPTDPPPPLLHKVKSFKMPSLSGFTKGPTLPQWVGGCLSICVPVHLLLVRGKNPRVLEGGREGGRPRADTKARGRPHSRGSSHERAPLSRAPPLSAFPGGAVSRAAVLQAHAAENPAVPHATPGVGALSHLVSLLPGFCNNPEIAGPAL